MDTDRIRNFCIVAHIDHGKSTLADRLLEGTETLDSRQMRDQVLDDNELERERGITIKLHAVRMSHRGKDGRDYEFNLIDTPGHVDFTYEVSRSLAACEGAILVVDATQGIQAQTLSNLFLALDANLEIIPVINKVDLPGAEPERRRDEVVDLLGVAPEDVLLASAKEGIGIQEILDAVVDKVPPPTGDASAPLRALIFDSYYDKYLGAVPSVRVIDGTVKPGMTITFGNVDATYEVTEVGCMRLGKVPRPQLEPGEVGYIVAAIKEVSHTRVGDTVLDATNPSTEMLKGYQEANPMVFAGLYPTDADDYEDLRDALERLKLNDASLNYEPETSVALGFGFRCGFLGLLHMEIIQERLDREFGVDLITTVPNVEYHVTLTDGSEMRVESPTALPDPGRISEILEPIVLARILCPAEYIGNVHKLCHERRGIFRGMSYPDPQRVELDFELPLSEIVLDFYDRLKSGTRGYASLDYEFHEWRADKLLRLDILVNSEAVDAFSVIIHEDKAFLYGRDLVRKLKDLIPRQQFAVALQATIGNNVVARTNVQALRKNVTAKCYGGDISRKRKLLEKQKAGKKRMKQVGTVEIPQEAFLAVLNLSDD
ncbi:MAG: elongation factor 4 [Gemmatimonadales bacterium]|nr:elongation factor 4 [Gemmatimonadales bacterium]MDG2240916.1 translation elongation factor 4 [Longimicrobiales bacterium]MBT3774355.1 elongation factor 4 [Gemmatimonadales bacterium]MBT3957203.1 elongation factor 4 [Gemmatimonadales bacterium]MBT4188848.1 elongation factor 4 [Gemmatimonadales bacterium]